MTGIAWTLAGLRDFFEAGGGVLWVILAATVVMWTLIVERLWFFAAVMPRRIDAAAGEWLARPERDSWWALSIREQTLSELLVEARRYMPMIRTLMAVLPLLGLLGTVTGMIQVFDVIAVQGTGDARAMASGVSAATIPTMAGLVAALSALYFVSALERRLRREVQRAEEAMTAGPSADGA